MTSAHQFGQPTDHHFNSFINSFLPPAPEAAASQPFNIYHWNMIYIILFLLFEISIYRGRIRWGFKYKFFSPPNQTKPEKKKGNLQRKRTRKELKQLAEIFPFFFIILNNQSLTLKLFTR